MATWQERADGYFFPRNGLSAAVRAKLQMLAFDETAQISDGGILLPFEKSFGLSEEDAELLSLPPRNPYRISIRTEAYIGAKDFRYVFDFLDGANCPVVKPQVNGALLRVGEEIFRLTADQFALINLVELGNKNFQPQLLTVKQIQMHAAKVDAQLEGYLSADNKKIVVPDKLSVDFTEDGDKVKVQPVLLENRDGKLTALDSADFQGAFGNRKKILEVYNGSDGVQYIFSRTLQDGLKQIKAVDTLSKADAKRYNQQPKELFSGAAFDFDYSDLVIGVEEMTIGSYQNIGGVKIDWTDELFHSELPTPETASERSPTFVLKIKENFERVDYAKRLDATRRKFFGGRVESRRKTFTASNFGRVAYGAALGKRLARRIDCGRHGTGQNFADADFRRGLEKILRDKISRADCRADGLADKLAGRIRKISARQYLRRGDGVARARVEKILNGRTHAQRQAEIIVANAVEKRPRADDLRNLARLSIFVRGNAVELHNRRRGAED